MKCMFCREGKTRPQLVTLERHNQQEEPIAVIHSFSADVCQICGEEYYSAEDLQNAEQLLGESPVRITQVPVYELQPTD